jgi:flagellar biosynthesis/type III secretory pathway protein FliH
VSEQRERTEIASADMLVALEQCRETNRKLNRRLQEVESKLKQNILYGMGVQAGWKEGYKMGQRNAAEALAQYKAATRKEMSILRAANAANEPRSEAE